MKYNLRGIELILEKDTRRLVDTLWDTAALITKYYANLAKTRFFNLSFKTKDLTKINAVDIYNFDYANKGCRFEVTIKRNQIFTNEELKNMYGLFKACREVKINIDDLPKTIMKSLILKDNVAQIVDKNIKEIQDALTKILTEVKNLGKNNAEKKSNKTAGATAKKSKQAVSTRKRIGDD